MTANLENETISRRGLMLVLSSPSGAGKTTLTRLLREQEAEPHALGLGDHAAAPAQRDRRHALPLHHAPDFADMRDRGELLEWAEVHGNFYGSPRREIDRALAAGQDILFDIDYQGAQQIAGQCGGRRRQRLHPAALHAGAEARGWSGAPRIRRR